MSILKHILHIVTVSAAGVAAAFSGLVATDPGVAHISTIITAAAAALNYIANLLGANSPTVTPAP